MSKNVEAMLGLAFPPAQPEPDRSHKPFGVKQLATVLVRDRRGNVGRINVSDFSAELHVRIE